MGGGGYDREEGQEGHDREVGGLRHPASSQPIPSRPSSLSVLTDLVKGQIEDTARVHGIPL